MRSQIALALLATYITATDNTQLTCDGAAWTAFDEGFTCAREESASTFTCEGVASDATSATLVTAEAAAMSLNGMCIN